MYICNNCKAEFEEPIIKRCTETFYSYGPKEVEYIDYYCPECGSENFEEYYGEDEETEEVEE